jgi:hypothetical protein
MSMVAFDPSSCALFAHIIEQTASTCLCSIKRQRIFPLARRWLHRNSERAVDALAEDVSDSVLDWVNSMDPRLAAALVLIIWVRIWVVSNEKTRE